jgi:hypothetical protein
MLLNEKQVTEKPKREGNDVDEESFSGPSKKRKRLGKKGYYKLIE